MKDAKGHGSDPRGAHSTGIQAATESESSRELRMYGDNNADLYRQSFVPVVTNLGKKMDKGVYDPARAEKLWQYHADRAAQMYHKEFGSPGTTWHSMFPPAIRKEAARQWERSEAPSIKQGEYKSNYNPRTGKAE